MPAGEFVDAGLDILQSLQPGAMRDELLVQQTAYEGVSNLWTRVVH